MIYLLLIFVCFFDFFFLYFFFLFLWNTTNLLCPKSLHSLTLILKKKKKLKNCYLTPKKTPDVCFAEISLCFTRNYYPVWHCFQSVIFRFQKSFLNICAVKISRSNIYLSWTFECFTANSKVTKIHGKYLLKNTISYGI